LDHPVYKRRCFSSIQNAANELWPQDDNLPLNLTAPDEHYEQPVADGDELGLDDERQLPTVTTRNEGESAGLEGSGIQRAPPRDGQQHLIRMVATQIHALKRRAFTAMRPRQHVACARAPNNYEGVENAEEKSSGWKKRQDCGRPKVWDALKDIIC